MCCWICVFAAVLVDLVVILLGFGCLLGRLCCLIVLVILSCVYWWCGLFSSCICL